jgi:cholesterol transport system auxiliary component
MRAKMQSITFLIIVSLILSTLPSCSGVNKTKQNIAVYDFGLFVPSESNQAITSKILIETPDAVESLNHNKVRYRLNYQNPSRVYFYSESRWAATPLELFSGKVSQMINITKTQKSCSLKLKIESFDHVFQTANASDGVVQLSALVIEKGTKKIVSNQLITESVISPTPNAQGGTAALGKASELSLRKAIDWGNKVAEDSELCH